MEAWGWLQWWEWEGVRLKIASEGGAPGLMDGLDVGDETKEGDKDDSKDFGLSN